MFCRAGEVNKPLLILRYAGGGCGPDRAGRGLRGRQGGVVQEDGRNIGGCWQSLSQNALVQGFLFYPDGRVDGQTPPILATQHVLAELG